MDEVMEMVISILLLGSQVVNDDLSEMDILSIILFDSPLLKQHLDARRLSRYLYSEKRLLQLNMVLRGKILKNSRVNEFLVWIKNEPKEILLFILSSIFLQNFHLMKRSSTQHF